MAEDKLDISSLFGDTIKQISGALSGETQKKKTTKKSASKSSSAKTKTAINKAANAGIVAAKKATATKKTTAKKTSSTGSSSTKKSTSSKKSGTILLEINGRQIDFKTIEQKAAKLGGNCYVVVNEKKIYNDDGKSVSLF